MLWPVSNCATDAGLIQADTINLQILTGRFVERGDLQNYY
jgi:hypothetical protein